MPIPGESNEECRKRVMSLCRTKWHSQEDVRKFWGDKARELNLDSKRSRQNALVSQKVQPEATQQLGLLVDKATGDST